MRRWFGIAGAIAGLVACTRFGTDDTETPAVEDAGAKKIDAAVAPTGNDAGADVEVDAGFVLPSDAFSAIDAGAYDVFDDFQRDDLPSGGPFDWTEEFGGNPNINVIGYESCDTASCSKPTVAWAANDEGGWGYLSSTLASGTKVLRFDLTMAIARASHDGRGQAQLVSIQLENDRFIFLDVKGTDFRLGDQYRDAGEVDYHTDFTTLGSVPDNRWSKYRFYVNLSLGVAALEKDGVLSGTVRSLRQQVITKPENVRVGVTYAQFDSFRVRFDDVGLKQR